MANTKCPTCGAWLLEHPKTMRRDYSGIEPALRMYQDGQISGGKLRECVSAWADGKSFKLPEPEGSPLNWADELQRAYRCIRGFYTFVWKKQLPDDTMLAYQSPVIAAACRFVAEDALDGARYFEGKQIEVLQKALAH